MTNKHENKPIPEKRNPLFDDLNLPEEEKEEERARGVRVREHTYQYLRRYAFEKDTTMIEAVEEAVELLRQKNNN